MVDSLSREEVEQYLTRIRYSGPREPTIEVLRKLQRCHILSVPFENLSVYGREQIFLTIPWLFDKVVRRHRGGFCYELNTIFQFLLDFFGFDYKTCVCQVFSRKTGKLGPPLDHMCLAVTIEEKVWLSDVAFGDSCWDPLLFTAKEQQLESGTYRIRKEGDIYFYEEKAKIVVDEFGQEKLDKESFEWCGDPSWEPRHRFEIAKTTPDFSAMLQYHQTNAKSPFTHDHICSIAKPWGRFSLTSNKLTTTTFLGNNKVKKVSQVLEGEEDVVKELEDKFGIKRENCFYPTGSIFYRHHCKD